MSIKKKSLYSAELFLIKYFYLYINLFHICAQCKLRYIALVCGNSKLSYTKWNIQLKYTNKYIHTGLQQLLAFYAMLHINNCKHYNLHTYSRLSVNKWKQSKKIKGKTDQPLFCLFSWFDLRPMVMVPLLKEITAF